MLIEVCLILISVFLIINTILLIKISRKDNSSALTDISNAFNNIDKSLSRVESSVKDEISRNRNESSKNSQDTRVEINNSFKNFSDTTFARINEIANSQKNQLETFSNQLNQLTKSNEDRFDKLITSIENKLKSLQDDNNKKLEQMRETVDEKLHDTLEKRLGESFKIVSDRLELVHKGLGEMQTLASGVGDLKKVLSNVKSRGVFGEIQLGHLLEDILTVDQYSKNVKTKEGSNDIVEFAVKLPGQRENAKTVWLPIDAKFPIEDYQLLEEAYESVDKILIENSRKQLVNTIKKCAKDIKDKYLDPPNTTDFGIMFLPYESLYAEILRNVGLIQMIQKEFKVVITGPSTLSAFLNSLQMGFRTLAIEKRSSEVWTLLGAVKTDFSNFGDVLERTKKKLDSASKELDSAEVRTRAIVKKLRDVQELPKKEGIELLEEGPLFENHIYSESEQENELKDDGSQS